MENERLIESVSKVTDLLRANQYLRDEIDKLTKGSDVKDNDNLGELISQREDRGIGRHYKIK